jgi:hypothetical protein
MSLRAPARTSNSLQVSTGFGALCRAPAASLTARMPVAFFKDSQRQQQLAGQRRAKASGEGQPRGASPA